MWSSTDDGEGEHFITTSNNGIPCTSFPALSNPTRKTMEDVWKDINLPSLTDHLSSSTTTGSSVEGMAFQDFLGRTFVNDSSSTSNVGVVSAEATTFTASPASSLLPKPSIALSLSSTPEFQFLDNIDPLRPPPQFQNHVISAPSLFFMSSLTSSSPLEALACSSDFSPFCDKKRVSDSEDSPHHRRHERMIKNRESAARSRARKQAYTNELEIEIGHLKKEIAKLRKAHEDQQRLSLLGRTDQLPKNHKLCRASTAPF